MHNTLNPLYKYISHLIIEFFEIQEIKPGERYNLYLEEEDYVRQLVEALYTDPSFERTAFAYRHPSGQDTFESFTIDINGTHVLVASSEHATENYFTMLRNGMSDQASGFENTALFIIYSQKLESISGGTGNLDKEGMPLHYLSFRERVANDIAQSASLKSHEKEILTSILQFKTKTVLEDNNTIFDYESVINSLSKGKIDPEDFQKLGLFPHQELATKGTKIEDDISENFKLFGEFEEIFTEGDPEIALKDRLSDHVYSKFIKDDWKKTDFTDIQKWLEAEKSKSAPEIVSIECRTKDVILWKRPDGNTSSKKRHFNCILFNNHKLEEVSIDVTFDQRTRKEGIVYKGSDLDIQSSGFHLLINFPAIAQEGSPFHLVEYKDPASGKKYTFRILHLPFGTSLLTQFEPNFLIKAGTSGNSLSIEDDDILVFNDGAEFLLEDELEYGKNYILSEDTALKLTCNYGDIDEEDIYFQITVENIQIPVHIKPDFEPPRPISGLDVWKEKRINRADFRYKQEGDIIKIQLRTEQQERTVSGDFRKNLVIERRLTDSDAYTWLENSNESIADIAIDLDPTIAQSFNELRHIFRLKGVQPSLAFLSDEEIKIATKYVHTVLSYISDFKENQLLTVKQKNVFLLGVVRETAGARRIKLSPYHPLHVAYQLKVNEVLKDDSKCYNAILKRLTPNNLLPYIEGETKEIYIPIESTHSPEWSYYSIYSDTKHGIAKSYVADLVTTKIKDFKSNYSILFNQSNHAPIKINVINQGDCKEVLLGLFEFYRTELNSRKNLRLTDLTPIEVFIYGSENLVNKFEELTFYPSVAEIEQHLQINLKTNSFDKEDLLNTFFSKVSFYSRSFPTEHEQFEYAHITFYQFDTQKANFSFNNVNDVNTGLSLNGLLSDVSFVAHQNTYRTGFGTKFLPQQANTLTDLAIRYNAFAKVASNDDPYDSSKALCTTINHTLRTQLERLYVNSHWVTYIDPRVALDFFKDNTDLVIIHYSDQYTNSSGYDAITVSRKTEQYAFVVKEFLTKHNVDFDGDKDTIPIINFFNAINGDWLLGLVRQRSHFPKEKLSLLSGVKTALTFLYSPHIIWVPISLEEVLRVSGNAGLKMEDGLFSAKNLGGIGSYSDDLLMIGLEQRNSELLMHFYPIELKIGNLNLVKKGKAQGAKTAELIYKHLLGDGFITEFYKNFFAKLVLTSVEKIELFQIWENQQWNTILTHYRAQLLNNEFTVSKALSPLIGDFGLIYFGNDTISRTLKVSENCMEINLLAQDGYDFLVKSVDQLLELFHQTKTTIDTDRLLAMTYEGHEVLDSLPPPSQRILDSEEITIKEVESADSETKSDSKKNHTEGMKILFGTDLNRHQPVIWEPNNTDKVMHTNTGIIGTMGTGKTQFTKSLIAQMYKYADQNPGAEKMGILIFDYKGDYVKDDFKEATNAKVFEPHQLPYNPLALDATASSKPMLPLHTANDIKETIASAFNLGNVQKQKLRDIIVAAYESKGIERAKRDTWTKPSPTLGDVCNIYLDDPNIAHDSLYAAISNLSDFEIFESDPSKTQSLYSLIEGVVVINLSGYDESIQNLIVAITLDAFYTQMQRHGHSSIEGDLRQLRKIILVDEADNFLGKNFQSLKKILKEGREFGVGTVLSTQFLNHFATGENEYSNYILTWVIHRVNEIKMKEIESLFALDNKTQKENLLKTIKGLEKHQSVVNLAGSEPLVIRDKAFWELEM